MKVKRFDSSEGNVWKYVYHLNSAIAESVLYQYESFDKRTVICCSVQSGCPVGCTFCGTGKQFIRNLTSVEIIDQIRYILDDKDIDPRKCEKFQIMFMSMGEPFLNYAEVRKTIIELAIAFPDTQLLVSTIGPAKPAEMVDFLHLSAETPNVGLQFSIHEAFDSARNDLIPYKNKLTLRQIRDYGIKWNKMTGRPVYLNYCVTGENTCVGDIMHLKDLFSPECFYFTFSVVCQSNENMKNKSYKMRDEIHDVMTKFIEDGYNVRMFDPAGQDDIGAGCGQLFYTQKFLKKFQP